MTRKHRTRRMIGTVALTGAALGAGLGASLSAFAQGKGIDEPFREGYRKALAGKTVAYVPVALGFDLAQGWLEGLKKELEPLGVKIVVRDPNWNTNAGAQAVTTLISEKPRIVCAPDCGFELQWGEKRIGFILELERGNANPKKFAARKLERLFRAKELPFEIRVYPGQGHRFTGEDDKDAYLRSLAFFDKHVRDAGGG